MAKVKKNKGLTLLDIYEIAMTTGSLDSAYKFFGEQSPIGLCPLLERMDYDTNHFSKIMSPTEEDFGEMVLLSLSVAYWASGLHVYHSRRGSAMTPLRQNILLLYAAYLGEL